MTPGIKLVGLRVESGALCNRQLGQVDLVVDGEDFDSSVTLVL